MSRSRLTASTLLTLLIPAVVMLGAPGAHAEPTEEEVKALAAKLDEAGKALAHQRGQLDESDRALLSARMVDAKEALKHYLKLAEQGKSRKAVQRSLYMAGGAVVADDVTGVGTADDVLLPIIALGVMITYATTNAPAAASELDVAWAHLLSQVQSVAHVAATVQSKRMGPCSCVCYKKGVGPDGKGQKSSPAVCWAACKEDGFSGYRCGGGGVIWMQ